MIWATLVPGSCDGAEAVVARNSADALRQLDHTGFQMVIIDIHMARIDGVLLLGQIRRRGCMVPVLGFSGGSIDQDRRRYLAAGFADMIGTKMDAMQADMILDSYLPPTTCTSKRSSPASLDQPVVLVVDADAMNRQLVVGLLQGRGVRVITAAGYEAVEA